MTITNQNFINKQIRKRRNLGNAWYHSFPLKIIYNVDGQLERFQFYSALEVKVMLQLKVSQSVSQSVSQGIEPTLRLVTRYYFLSEGCCLKVAVLSLYGALSDERSGLSFVILSL
jgi:hypothetical protein